MRYGSPIAFRRALEDRLLTYAREAGTPLVRLRKQVVFDRLLARLHNVAPDRWLLKGALALDFRFPGKARATKDMDLGHADDEERATADFIAAQAVDLGDFFVFAIERVRPDDSLEVATLRYHARAELAGRLFEEVLIDVAFADDFNLAVELVTAPGLLEFAGIAPSTVPALPLERHVAEKVHAYTRVYGDGLPSTRPKDLADILVIAATTRLDADRLISALRGTFDARATHELPEVLPEPPADWVVAYRRLAKELDLVADLQAAHRSAAGLLDPALSGAAKGHWDPVRKAWRGSGED